MPYYRRAGDVPRKRHTIVRDPDGALRYEELVGAEGFSSDSTLLYHRHIPAAIVATQSWAPPDGCLRPNEPLRNRHFRADMLSTGGDLVTGRRVLAGNDDVTIAYAAADAPSALYRNAVGDECIFLQDGRATLETQFGPIVAAAGDYLVLPRGTVHRWVPEGMMRALIIEAAINGAKDHLIGLCRNGETVVAVGLRGAVTVKVPGASCTTWPSGQEGRAPGSGAAFPCRPC